MMLTATELGLGSVWICYFKPDVIKEEFKLPLGLEPINIWRLDIRMRKQMQIDMIPAYTNERICFIPLI